MTAIAEVAAIDGFDPLKVHPDNISLAAYYLPSLIYEYTTALVEVRSRSKELTVDVDSCHQAELERLLASSSDNPKVGGVRMTATLAGQMAKNSPRVLVLRRKVCVCTQRAEEIAGYISALEKSFGICMCLLGHEREHIKFGASHRKWSMGNTSTAGQLQEEHREKEEQV